MLISQYKAAQISGVSKQAINLQSQKIPPPNYFVETKTGFRVDGDHPEFKMYCDRTKERKKYTEQDEVKFNRLLLAVVDGVRETFNPSGKKLNELLDLIDKKYKAG